MLIAELTARRNSASSGKCFPSSTCTSVSGCRFKSKYELPFTLLADPNHEVAEKYGVWREKNLAGKKYMGINRSTFVIDPEGNVARAMMGIKPAGHASEVLDSVP